MHMGQGALPKSFIGPARPGAAIGVGSWSGGSRFWVALPVPARGGRAPPTGYLTRSFRYSQPSLVYSQALDGAADRADITAMTPAGREGGPGAW